MASFSSGLTTRRCINGNNRVITKTTTGATKLLASHIAARWLRLLLVSPRTDSRVSISKIPNCLRVLITPFMPKSSSSKSKLAFCAVILSFLLGDSFGTLISHHFFKSRGVMPILSLEYKWVNTSLGPI